MTHRLILGAWLTVVWLELWGGLTWANLLSGVLVATLIVVMWAPREPLGLRPHPIGLAKFVMFVAIDMVTASYQVAREVVRRKPQLREAIIAVPLVSTTRGMVTVISAAISLTPGTLVVDISRSGPNITLYVHVLDLDDRDALIAHIAELEQAAIAGLVPSQRVVSRLESESTS